MVRVPSSFENFCRSEDGAITVDWVLLTAGVVGLALAVTAVVAGGLENQSTDISDTLVALGF